MRVLMMNTGATGGAGIAARRQMEALHGLGHECHMLTLETDWQHGEVALQREGAMLTLRLPGWLGSFNSSLASAYCSGNRTEISNTWISLWPAQLPFDEQVLEIAKGYDVVHLHWVSHLISTRSLTALAQLGKRLVITGHDMNWFTGGCHYSAGCSEHESHCVACPQLAQDPFSFIRLSGEEKRLALAQLPVTWLFPSEWLAGLFKRSATGAEHTDVEVVRNCIDTCAWFPADLAARRQLRHGFGIAEEDLFIVAGAQSNDERRKGFDFVEGALQQVAALLPDLTGGRSVVMATFGQGKPEIHVHSPWLQHMHLGTIKELELPALMQSADLLLFPSREENFSNTILESLMCGCPVLGFSAGGVPEAVIHGVNGRIAPVMSDVAFGDELAWLLRPGALKELGYSTRKWRAEQQASYDAPGIANQLERIYRRSARPHRDIARHALIHSLRWHRVSQMATVDDGRRDYLLRQVAIGAARETAASSVSVESIRPIYFGFCAPEKHPQWGCIQWVTQNAAVSFDVKGSVSPYSFALVLQITEHEFPMSLWKRARTGLTVQFDGEEVTPRFIAPRGQGSHAYIVCPVFSQVEPDAEHRFDLLFDSLGVSRDLDRRELCLLVSGACVSVLAHGKSEPDLSPASCALLLLRSAATSMISKNDGFDASITSWLDIL